MSEYRHLMSPIGPGGAGHVPHIDPSKSVRKTVALTAPPLRLESKTIRWRQRRAGSEAGSVPSNGLE